LLPDTPSRLHGKVGGLPLEIFRKKVRNISKIKSNGMHAGLDLYQNLLKLMIFLNDCELAHLMLLINGK
jgi:hypothetical protein